MVCTKLSTGLQFLSRNGCNRALGSSVVQACRNYSSDLEKPTHTGQVFYKDDYRNVRFVNAKRYVNENWGIKLIDEVPPIEVIESVAYCDGGDANLGHPNIYINLDKPGPQICGYCGLRFVKRDGHHH
ncbi:NADH dehydrogenase [ubiquinone] iron-sulfur protein 6, mitochondrial-like [Rhagoletis pomonella]|uniref:NADH dehydrogenase [ubiquinone] iron-sulfur protein 6, mitochondrial-like n=1 Tax=Rhagoletis pomonella TaxID=28610 RepID=UPI00178200A1|nr:NADH dehydrogenase [ubiquinone] iron-sulfur protein 6, mitochondrial-like [Rhagoletis pomonella]